MDSIDKAGYHLEQGVFGVRAVLTSDWNAGICQALLRRPIAEFELNRGKGWRGEDLSFLSDFPELLALKIIGKTAHSLSPIHALHNLKALHVLAYCKDEIRFDEFPRLTECGLQWRPKAMSVFDCRGLQNLFVNGFSKPDTALFGKLLNLEALTILGSPTKSLQGLAALTKIRSLRLGELRALESLSGIENLTTLEKLEIDTCRKVRSIEEVGGLLNLHELYLDRLGDVQSLKPIERLVQLRRLTFVDSTSILDGDLSPLLALPHLESVSFQNRRHYTHRRENFGHPRVAASIH
jgi:Leucine-rich repeat (LRR) protein